MVIIDDIRPGNLLLSAQNDIYCITEVIKNNKEPEKSVIIGKNEKDISFTGTPDKWFYLWSKTCNIKDVAT